MTLPLYIRISDTEFSFARFDALQTEGMAFQVHHVRPQSSFTMNLREAKDTCSILREPASRVEVLLTTPVTPVPLTEFQEEDCERIYRYSFAVESRMRYFYDSVPAANAVLVYGLDETVCHTLEDNFGELHYTSVQTALLQYFSQKALTLGRGRRVFVYVHEGRADIAVFEDTRLLMQNSYDIRTLSDVVYYVFNLSNHMAIDVSATPYFVAGDAQLLAAVTDEMRKYAAKVYAINPSADFNRHPLAVNPDVPYDMVLHLLR